MYSFLKTKNEGSQIPEEGANESNTNLHSHEQVAIHNYPLRCQNKIGSTVNKKSFVSLKKNKINKDQITLISIRFFSVIIPFSMKMKSTLQCG